jgi:oxygen-independent coproporphyrinogen III oxidase
MLNALYIHIPFCRSKCPYCAFVSLPGQSQLHGPYQQAVAKELAILRDRFSPTLDSLFIGGGTPTALPAAMLGSLVERCRQLFSVSDKAEITVEANPGTIDLEYVRVLIDHGINRLSLGFQSLQDNELAALGRQHSGAQAVAAFRAAREAGMANINIDLMTGIPGQTQGSWERTLTAALTLQPDHCSIYELTIEENTPFGDKKNWREGDLPGEEELMAIDKLTLDLSSRSGLGRYELANYASTGKQCRHNLVYWHNEGYLAVGAAAVSCINGVRERRIADPARYISRMERGVDVVVERETLAREASFRETVVIGLRLLAGVSRRRLQDRYCIDPIEYYGTTLAHLVSLDLLTVSGEMIRLTDTGRIYANRIMAELV